MPISDWVQIAAISASLFGVVFAIGAAIAARRAERRAWEQLATARRQLVEQRRRLSWSDFTAGQGTPDDPFDSLDEYWSFDSRPREAGIILRVAQIERLANQFLDYIEGFSGLDGAPRKVFDLRRRLAQERVWTTEDLAVFDRAMQVRNAVVHGSPKPEGIAEPTRTELDRLSGKIVTALEGDR